MTPIQLKCLGLIKAGLFEYPLSACENVDWNSVYYEMKNQNIIGIPNNILNELPISEDLLERWTYSIIFQVNHSFAILEMHKEIQILFNNKSIPFITLKGISNLPNYPQLEFRQLGDIDLLVSRDYFEAAEELLLNNGFTVLDSNNPRHLILIRDGIELELHHYYAYTKDNNAKQFDEHLFEMISNQKMVNIEGYELNLLPILESGLIILMHINENLKRGIKLRHILDFVMFVEKNVDDRYWETIFQKAAEEYGLQKLAKTIARSGQIYLGLKDSIHWCKDIDETVCISFIEYVFQGEEEFMKRDLNSSYSRVIMNSKLAGGFFQNLQFSGTQNWKTLKKYPYLKPFAWAYQLCRYGKLGIQRLRKGDSFPIKNTQNEVRIETLKSFGVTQLPED